MYWKKLNEQEIRERVALALNENVDFREDSVFGIPGTHLDERVFPKSKILEGRPFLSTLVANPNHIGIHTEGESESFFKGTQKLEQDVIQICGEEFMQASPGAVDGYVASGGTEANIQGIWLLRNFFQGTKQLTHCEIAIVSSSDTHYSVYKAGNLLGLQNLVIPVEEDSRQMCLHKLKEQVEAAQKQGVKAFIVLLNMATTMFGSVDDIEAVCGVMEESATDFQVHIDAAFGGFIYPVTNPQQKLNFTHPKVASVTMDAHKMLQAPYGTGVFLCRKGMIQYTSTEQASYVQGFDSTLCGSRSGANAVAIWMILHSYGSEDAVTFCRELVQRTEYLCQQLSKLKIRYFHQPHMNIVTMDSADIPKELVQKYGLVGERPENPQWVKIVVMDHVKRDGLEQFVQELRS